MRNYFLCIAFAVCCLTCFSQKPTINSDALNEWTSISIGSPQISNNGAYAMYIIENQPHGKSTLIVTDTKKSRKIEVPGVRGYSHFSSDSKHVVFIKEKDSLGILELGSSEIKYISNVQSFKLSKKANPEWLTYQLNNPRKSLIIENMITGKEKTLDFVQQHLLSDDGSTLLYLAEEKKDSVTQALHWFDIASGNIKTIWQGTKAGNFVFDKTAKQVAFVVDAVSQNDTEKTFWYYEAGTDRAIELATNRFIENDSMLKLESISYFSGDNSSLFIKLKQKDFPKPPPSPVDVWSYTDLKLQSKQLNELRPKIFTAVINIQQSHLVRLQWENELLHLPSPMYNAPNNLGLVTCFQGDASPSDVWSAQSSYSVFLISLKNGKRILVPELDNQFGKVSPEEKYIVYYNPRQKNYFSYEIVSGIIRNLTKGIQTDWRGYLQDEPRAVDQAKGIAGWLKNDEGVLIYDHNDIWQIDMAGKKPPHNLSNGYGKKHNIVFSLSLGNYNNILFSNNEQLIINAFNRENKENGYYRKTLSKSGDPELLSMGPYVYDIPNNPFTPDGINFTPEKALNADVYLVQRMKANEAPNILVTSDFKTFTTLSDIQPQKKYNWLISELVIWKGLDGGPLQGILYKPENFDPHKKYPIIFHYYDQKSDGLHAFLKPDILGSSININIPWYVSNGYLVFLPDIHYKIGETGESIINSVVSAAQYLSKMPWVNVQKMGIQGGSFGGYETNYLVTHTSLFSAACSSASIADLVSNYGSIGILHDGSSRHGIIQYGQYRLGASLWERPDIYIKNSPVFSAAQVTTPLLIMHATKDGACPFENALEFFTALRRLGKKAWMLQYVDGNHGIWGKSAPDFSIRMQQFFDHYLKDSAAPRWMMYGIPAKDKGIVDGLDLIREKDPKTGKWITAKESGLLTDEEKKKVEALKKRKPITITLK